MKSFQVRIYETIVHTITVDAEDENAAVAEAHQLVGNEPEDFLTETEEYDYSVESSGFENTLVSEWVSKNANS